MPNNIDAKAQIFKKADQRVKKKQIDLVGKLNLVNVNIGNTGHDM